MLRINRDVEYALLALVALAGEGGGDAAGLLSARELAGRLSAPPQLFGKILQRLARAGLVRSVHGQYGGYRLGREARRITLQEVVRAIEGPVKIVPCLNEAGECGRRGGCAIRHGVRRVQRQVVLLLDSCTVQDLIDEEVADGVAGAGV